MTSSGYSIFRWSQSFIKSNTWAKCKKGSTLMISLPAFNHFNLLLINIDFTLENEFLDVFWYASCAFCAPLHLEHTSPASSSMCISEWNWCLWLSVGWNVWGRWRFQQSWQYRSYSWRASRGSTIVSKKYFMRRVSWDVEFLIFSLLKRYEKWESILGWDQPAAIIHLEMVLQYLRRSGFNRKVVTWCWERFSVCI